MTEPHTEVHRPNVGDTIKTFGTLDEAGLASLLATEKAHESPRATLISAIEAEQGKRAAATRGTDDGAPKAETNEAGLDAAAQAEGFADHAAKVAAGEAAAKAADAKVKRQARDRAKTAESKERGFASKPVDPEGSARLRELAADRGSATVTLGDEKSADRELPGKEVQLGLKRGMAITGGRVNFSAAGLSGSRRFTHAYVFEAGAKANSAPLARAELASPITVGVGEQVSFPVGALAFRLTD